MEQRVRRRTQFSALVSLRGEEWDTEKMETKPRKTGLGDSLLLSEGSTSLKQTAEGSGALGPVSNLPALLQQICERERPQILHATTGH